MEKKYISYDRALNKAMYLCSKSEKCKSDIRKKLFDWKSDPSDHERVIEELVKHRYIDEKRYASYYVKDKFRFNKWGRIKIRTMLFQKQIPENLIREAIDQINEEEYTETLEKLIEQKMKSIKGDDAYKKKNKLLQFASSRGFEAQLIYKLLDI